MSEAVTREEQYLAAMAGQTQEVPKEPVTRKEQYYAAILEKMGEGGSGASGMTEEQVKVIVDAEMETVEEELNTVKTQATKTDEKVVKLEAAQASVVNDNMIGYSEAFDFPEFIQNLEMYNFQHEIIEDHTAERLPSGKALYIRLEAGQMINERINLGQYLKEKIYKASAEQTFTFSFYCFKQPNPMIQTDFYLSTDGSVEQTQEELEGGQIIKYIFTITIPTGRNEEIDLSLNICLSSPSGGTFEWFLSSVKLERGISATQWTKPRESEGGLKSFKMVSNGVMTISAKDAPCDLLLITTYDDFSNDSKVELLHIGTGDDGMGMPDHWTRLLFSNGNAVETNIVSMYNEPLVEIADSMDNYGDTQKTVTIIGSGYEVIE